MHRARFASCDVCLAPSRWEGLGLPLYEATAFGLPIITNDKPPMSEMVLDGRSGLLVASVENGTTRSGVTAWDPEPAALTAAIERLGDRGRARAHARGRRRAARAAGLASTRSRASPNYSASRRPLLRSAFARRNTASGPSCRRSKLGFGVYMTLRCPTSTRSVAACLL